MISRIFITSIVKDAREDSQIGHWKSLELSKNIKKIKVLDCYSIDSKFNRSELEKIGNALANPILEKFELNKPSLNGGYTYAIEVGYLPGVTDNIAHTAKETISDLLRTKKDFDVYTSKVFLFLGAISEKDIEKFAFSIHNPLIEKATIYKIPGNSPKLNLPFQIPKVKLNNEEPVLHIPLAVSDEELIKIGKEGIMGRNGVRRGPLALSLPYMKAIQAYYAKLKKNPTDIELESLAQTWSEHCKHTIFANPINEIKDGLYKTYIKGATNIIRKEKGKNDFCVSVFSDNSGGILFDNDFLITHKVETHNAPSALDPFGGAITGIVGVNRDTIGFGLGAKPVANTYGFCFGYPNDTRALYRDIDKTQKMFVPKRIMEGVIRGVNTGGNCSGIPTVSGFVRYDERYRGKPLVFVGTIGLIPKKLPGGRLSHIKRAKAGDYIVMLGGRVGADGIHGATFSSTTMDSSSPATAVQIGDPITQKKMSDAIVKEARNMGLYNSITDDGAGGLSCSVAEMAKESGGAKVDLEKVPLKYSNLEPWQIWISESQERMTLAVPPKNWKQFKKLMDKRGVEATVIGKFTNSGKCVVAYKGKIIMDMSMDFLHNGLPKIELVSEKFVQAWNEPKARASLSPEKVLNELLKEQNLSGHSFVSEQYDHEVQASSVLKPLSGPGRVNTDAQVLRPRLDSKRGVVLSSSLYPSYGDISAYHMASCAIDTAIRNSVCAGGSLSHMAILDNFCWCSSNEKGRLAQLVEAVKACYDYSIGYGTPLISGKDSMFNDFKGYDENGKPVKISVPPTLLISAIGVTKDVYKTVSPEFKKSGDIIYILGETNDELGGSEYFKLLSRKEGTNNIGSLVPEVDWRKNKKIYTAFEKTIASGLINSAISVGSGGLAIALAKASIGGMLGCRVELGNLEGNAKTFERKLFSESQGRIVVSLPQKNSNDFERLIKNIPFTRVGKVTENGKFTILGGGKEVINTDVRKLSESYHSFSKKMQ
jgi:phosphoribosylformylglycinamidine synthase